MLKPDNNSNFTESQKEIILNSNHLQDPLKLQAIHGTVRNAHAWLHGVIYAVSFFFCTTVSDDKQIKHR